MLKLLLCAELKTFKQSIRRNCEQMLNAQVSEYRSTVYMGVVVGGGNDVNDP